MPHQPLRIAHRGASREHRENTLAAFARALQLGADAIELDVHVTADGVAIVHHDFDVAADGRRLTIARQAAATIRQLDLGGGERVPTLAEVIDLVSGGAELLVELKGHAIEDAILAALRPYGGPWAVHSFDHHAIERVAARAPQARRGLLFDVPAGDLPALVRRTGAHDLWPRRNLATQAFIDGAHALGTRVIAWTVNDPVEGAALIAAGIDGICTDDVRWLAPRFASRPAPG